MEFRVHERPHRVSNVLGCERGAVGEPQSAPETECDSAPLLADFPGNGQIGLEHLGQAIHANQDPPGEKSNRLGGFVLHLEWVKCLRLAVQAESQFTTGLPSHSQRSGEQDRCKDSQSGAALHGATSSSGRMSWKHVTTITSRSSGASLHGYTLTDEKSSRPRRRFPHEGMGSMTPRPRMLKLASVRMNSGIETQNCASRMGRRLGS